MPKGFTESEKSWIKNRLLEEGSRLFTAHGLKKTSVEELAKAAGISKGAFYLFHESKEALFMDVVEEIEKRVRGEILAAIDQPGRSPRARLAALFRKAFSLFRTIPLLQILTGSDYVLLFRRIPAEKVQAHLLSDRRFIEELIARCTTAGIPIQVEPAEISGLLYPLVLGILHEGDLGTGGFEGGIDILLELAAAYCLGEIDLESIHPIPPSSDQGANP
jgi:AcrR family transcriptional regulator